MDKIQLINPANGSSLHLQEDHLTDHQGNYFYHKGGAWRFVSDDNYASSFGFQWNKFEKTQIDRFAQGLDQSARRFMAVTNWDQQNLTNKNVLEVGSGAGRFTHVVLNQTAANLYSVDYSNAVQANFTNNGANARLSLFQASVYELPFAPAQFDKVFCFGVIQHTPDVKATVRSLAAMVRPGGELLVDFYPVKGWYTKIHAKYFFRPFTRRMTEQKLLSWIERNADRWIGYYRFLSRIKLGVLTRFLPICDIDATLPPNLDEATLREWVVLDTFDMFSPAYDQPQKLEEVVNWFREFGFENIVGEVKRYEARNTVTYVKGIKKI